MTTDLFHRTCPRCQVKKPLGNFPRNRSRPDGRGTYCRECHADKAAEYRAIPGNKEALRESQRRSIARAQERFQAELAKLPSEQREALGLAD
jgi:hypothetical protein